MARPKSALRKALEEKAAAHQAAAAAAEAGAETQQAGAGASNHHENQATSSSSGSGTNSDWSQVQSPSDNTTATTPSTFSTADLITTSPLHVKTPLALELERLSLPGITACNDRDWAFTSPAAAEAKAHLAPDFIAYFDGYPRPLTFEENVQGTRDLMEKDPGYVIEVVGVDSDVDEERGEGKVYLEIENRFTGWGMRGFSELRWRRDGKLTIFFYSVLLLFLV